VLLYKLPFANIVINEHDDDISFDAVVVIMFRTRGAKYSPIAGYCHLAHSIA